MAVCEFTAVLQHILGESRCSHIRLLILTDREMGWGLGKPGRSDMQA